MNLPRTVLAALFALAALRAQTASGHWEGSIQLRGMETAVEVDLAGVDGQLAGTVSNPGQNLKGLPLSRAAVNGRSVVFQIGHVPGERVFEGELSADGDTISGQFSQHGYSLPLHLSRAGEARIETPAKIPAISSELEGAWNSAGESKDRYTLTLSNRPDGAATGTLLNVEEGLEIPIAAIARKDATITLELRVIGGTYSGVLNGEAGELTGTYRQGALAVPITFRRAERSK
jgi:hypothetical protein